MAAELRDGGADALFVETDLREESAVAHLVDRTVSAHGRVDVLFSNAGVKNPLGPADTIEGKDWDWVLDTNTKATFLLAKHVVPHMKAQRSGSVVVNASAAGLWAPPNQPAYNASKSAEIHLARSLVADYGRNNVRVNAICPGPIGGDFAAKYIYKDPAKAERGQRGIGMLVPLGRMGSPEEVANVALFLASDESSFVTGAVIPIDGGMTPGIDVIGLSSRLGSAG